MRFETLTNGHWTLSYSGVYGTQSHPKSQKEKIATELVSSISDILSVAGKPSGAPIWGFASGRKFTGRYIDL